MPATPTLPWTGTLSYTIAANTNDGFPQAETVAFDWFQRTKYSEKPVRSGDNRTVKYTEITLEGRGLIWAQTSGVVQATDALATKWRRVLTQSGGQLNFSLKGYGTDPGLQVNVPGSGNTDVAYGPHPEILSLNLVGDDKAVLVEWRVVCHVAEVKNTPGPVGTKFDGALLEFTWEARFDQDGVTGLGTITYEITTEIALSRPQGSRTPTSTVDSYRASPYRPTVPLGFRLKSATDAESADRRRMKTTVVHEQMPFPLPVGVAAAEVDHEIDSDLRRGFLNWTGVVSGTLHFPAGTTKGIAWSRILLIFLSQITQTNGPPKVVAVNNTRVTLITAIRIRNQKLGLGVSFSIKYMLIHASLAEAFNPVSLFNPLPVTFADWQEDMQRAGGPWDPRGTAQLSIPASQDRIIDIGTRQPAVLPSPVGASTIKPGLPQSPKAGADPLDNGAWIYYESSAGYTEDKNTLAVHKPLDGSVWKYLSVENTINGAFKLANLGVFGPASNWQSARLYTMQDVGPGTPWVWYYGRAIRLGRKVPVPSVKQIGKWKVGQGADQARVVNPWFQCHQGGAAGGVPVFVAYWRLWFALPGPLNIKEAPSNPLLELDANES